MWNITATTSNKMKIREFLTTNLNNITLFTIVLLYEKFISANNLHLLSIALVFIYFLSYMGKELSNAVLFYV